MSLYIVQDNRKLGVHNGNPFDRSDRSHAWSVLEMLTEKPLVRFFSSRKAARAYVRKMSQIVF